MEVRVPTRFLLNHSGWEGWECLITVSPYGLHWHHITTGPCYWWVLVKVLPSHQLSSDTTLLRSGQDPLLLLGGCWNPCSTHSLQRHWREEEVHLITKLLGMKVPAPYLAFSGTILPWEEGRNLGSLFTACWRWKSVLATGLWWPEWGWGHSSLCGVWLE